MKRRLFNFVRVIFLVAVLIAAIWGTMQISSAHREAFPHYHAQRGSGLLLVLLLLVWYISVILLRVGTGRLSGYRLYHLQLPFVEVCRQGKVKLRLSKHILPGLFMLPPRTDASSPYRLYMLTVPLSLLLLVVITIVLIPLCWATAAARQIITLPLVCIAVLFCLLLPRRQNDLLTQLLDFRHPENLRAWECTMHISAALSEDKLLIDMPAEWFPDKPLVLADNINVQIHTINGASRMIQQQHFTEAYELLHPLFDLRPTPENHPSIACAFLNGAVCEAMTGLPPTCLSQLDHPSVQYMTPPTWHGRMLTAKYARALFVTHDENEASALLKEIEAVIRTDRRDQHIVRILQEKAGLSPTIKEEIP